MCQKLTYNYLNQTIFDLKDLNIDDENFNLYIYFILLIVKI